MGYGNEDIFEMLCDIGIIMEDKLDTEVLDDCKFYSSTLGCVISDGIGCSNMCKDYVPKED